MKIISKTMVKPAEPTWKGILPLTELDHISVITHSSLIYFYHKPTQQNCWQSPSNNNNNIIMDTLKDSLSRVLVPFYPLAGRLGWLGHGRMALECNAKGAELIEVESTMKISDFGDFYSSSENFQDLLGQVDYYGKPIKDVPVLVLQITRFACGGFSIGLSNSHVVLDGRSTFHFIKEWARLTRGDELIHITPFVDRRVLQDQDHFFLEEKIDDDLENGNYFSKLEKGKKATPTFVVLSKNQIERLKEVANSNVRYGHLYSRFEVIGAHIWRCVCMARELNNEDITSFDFLVDVRSRMDPPLPPSYFGNAVLDTHISTSVGELLSKPLSYACSKIREASMNVTSKHVSKFIDHLKNQQSLIKYQYFEERGKMRGPSCGDNNVSAVSWLNLAARNVDFGWGNEVYMGPSMVYGCDGDIMVTPYNTNDESVLVAAFLQPKTKFQEFMSLPILRISRI